MKENAREKKSQLPAGAGSVSVRRETSERGDPQEDAVQALQHAQHDMRNILMVLEACLDELKISRKGGSTGDAEVLGDAKNAARVLMQIVGSLDVAGANAASAQQVRAGDLIRRSVRLCTPMLAPDTAEISVEDASEGAQIETDPSRCIRALINLLLNAAQAIGTQRGRIAISAQVVSLEEIPPAVAEQEGLKAPQYVGICVADTGSGMDLTHQAMAGRERFTTKADGSGIGLRVVREFLDSCHGGLHVQSRIGHGSAFTLFIPLFGQRPPSRSVAPRPSGIRRARPAI